MTEFENSIQGLLHVFDNEMMPMFHRACRLTKEYNQTNEDETERHVQILSHLLKKAGKTFYTHIVRISSCHTAVFQLLKDAAPQSTEDMKYAQIMH